MAGLEERRKTLTRLKTLAGGRAWQGSVDDDVELPRVIHSGAVRPHIVIDFGAPVRTTRDRNIAYGDRYQPHVLPANIACIAGDADSAQALMSAAFDLLVDWEPSETSDAWEAKGGYGTRRAATGNTPTRFIEGIFLECVIMQDIHPSD